MRHATMTLVLMLCGCTSEGAAGPKGERGPAGPRGEAGPAAAINGSRLQIRWEAGDDGSARAVGWFDHDLGVDCAFALSADGIKRCLPFEVDEAGSVFGVAYTDPACSSPVLIATRLCQPIYGAAPSYIRYTTEDACSGFHVRPVLDPIESPGPVYGQSDAGGCDALPEPAAVLELGEEVPPDAFVRGGNGIGLTL